MNVLSEFQAAIQIEKEKTLREFEQLMALPLDERVTKGSTLANLTLEFEFFDGQPNRYCPPRHDFQKYISLAKIECEENKSKFKEGNPVMLSNGNIRFKMEIEEDSIENFILKPNDFDQSTCFIDFNDYPRNNWEINTVKLDIGTELLTTAAEVLEGDHIILDKIENFLNGRTQNRYSNYAEKVDYLNESQNTAYHKAINATDFCIIQGPPGTGKTETIGYIAKHFLDLGKKVFITAPNHTAINNCLNAISDKVQDPSKVIKIGEKAQYKEILNNENITKKTRLKYSTYKFSPDLSQSGIAIGATAYSLCYPTTGRLDGWEFDVCIIDEAAQLSIPLSIAAMCRTGKYIFVGDHEQLDPIIPKGSNNEMFSESIFSRLARIYKNEINLLNTSYRLNSSLIKIPNILFYDNLLKSADKTQEDIAQYECNYHSEVLNSETHKLILHNVFDGQSRSPFEAKLVAELVSDLLQNGINIKDIGIMSPYRAQVREIKKEVKKVLPRTLSKPFDTLFIDTVDSMQGQERDYIIYSLANTYPFDSIQRLEFFYSPNRLNVAITRAIKKCIVIANSQVFEFNHEELSNHEEYLAIKDSLHVFSRYHKMVAKVEINQTDDTEL